jgi:hypothetical protein
MILMRNILHPAIATNMHAITATGSHLKSSLASATLPGNLVLFGRSTCADATDGRHRTLLLGQWVSFVAGRIER